MEPAIYSKVTTWRLLLTNFVILLQSETGGFEPVSAALNCILA